jgi:hypothetical protein
MEEKERQLIVRPRRGMTFLQDQDLSLTGCSRSKQLIQLRKRNNPKAGESNKVNNSIRKDIVAYLIYARTAEPQKPRNKVHYAIIDKAVFSPCLAEPHCACCYAALR